MLRSKPIAIVLFACSLFASNLTASPAFSADSPQGNLNRLRALGTAYMEEEDFPNAIDAFQKAASSTLASVSDTINLGLAHYHGDRNEDSIRILQQAHEKDPKNPFANYTLGLAYKKIGDSTNALTFFQQVADVDQSDAATLYNLGLANFNLKNSDEAAKWFEKTVVLDPKHTPAYYNLFLYYARIKKDMTHAKELMATFQELKKTEADRPADAVDEGKFLGPIEFEIPLDDQVQLTSELKVQFSINPTWTSAIQKIVGSETGKESRFLAVIPDIIQRQTALVIQYDNHTSLLILDAKGAVLKHADLGPGFFGCAPADYDNDGDIDLFLYTLAPRVCLMQNDGSWNLTDATDKLSLPTSVLGYADALWSDFDADGDLDLLLAGGLNTDVILQNNGNGTFSDRTQDIQGLNLGNSMAFAVADMDNDNDLDILRVVNDPAAFPSSPKLLLELYANQREIHFQKIATREVSYGYSNSNITPIKIMTKDIDNDGQIDIVLIGLAHFMEATDESCLFTLNKQGEIVPLGSTPLPIQTIADVNNDGYEDLLISSITPAGAVFSDSDSPRPPVAQIMINQTPKPFRVDRDVIDLQLKSDTPQASYSYAAPQTADLDFDGDLDLLASTREGLRVFENQNGSQNHSITLKIKGSKNTADGFGSKIIVKDDLFSVKKEIVSPVTHIGIGQRDQIDVTRITWPNGIFQNLIHTPAGMIQSVTEKPGYAGSCLFVYTWNGKNYEFIADSLCNAPLGLYVGGGAYYPPNPDEYIRILDHQLRPKDNQYEILMREELREITYLDQMELISATHPQAVEIHSNECFTMPPFPEFKLIGLSKNAHVPRSVIDNRGRNVTDLITKNDFTYPIPWEGQSRMDGVVDEHYFEIDLGDVDNSKPLYLFMTGYLDWPNSSNCVALEQNPEHNFVMPLLQVKNEKGEWTTVRNPMGFPAGKLKTVPVDLTGVFPTSDRTIRIVSTVQVHWDRMLVDPTPYLDGFTIEHYPFQSAELRYGGYARAYQLSEHGPQWYDYSTRATNSRWDYQIGNFTRYGDVTPLLTAFDDRYIIIQHGDEVCTRFDASAASKNGETGNRTFFMKALGWVKDLDANTAYGQTVEPLPFKTMSAYPYGANESYPWDEEHMMYYMEYNTRAFTRRNTPLSAPRIVAEPQDGQRSLGESE